MSFLTRINDLLIILAQNIQRTYNRRRIGGMIAYAMPPEFYQEVSDWYDNLGVLVKAENLKIQNSKVLSDELKKSFSTEASTFDNFNNKDKKFRIKDKNLHITLQRESPFIDVYDNFKHFISPLFKAIKPLTVTIESTKFQENGKGDLIYFTKFNEDTVAQLTKAIKRYIYNYNNVAKKYFSEDVTNVAEPKEPEGAHVTIAKYTPQVQRKYFNIFNRVIKPIENNEKLFIGKTYTCNKLYLYYLNRTLIYDINTMKYEMVEGI